MSAAGCVACAGTWPPASNRIIDGGLSTAYDPAPREAVWAVAHVPVPPGADAAGRIGALRARLS